MTIVGNGWYLEAINTPHSSPSWLSYEVSVVSFLWKIVCYLQWVLILSKVHSMMKISYLYSEKQGWSWCQLCCHWHQQILSATNLASWSLLVFSVWITHCQLDTVGGSSCLFLAWYTLVVIFNICCHPHYMWYILYICVSYISTIIIYGTYHTRPGTDMHSYMMSSSTCSIVQWEFAFYVNSLRPSDAYMRR